MFRWLTQQFRKPSTTPTKPQPSYDMPPLASDIVVVIGDRVAGWIDPRVVAKLREVAWDRMVALQADAAREGKPNPFPEDVPIHAGWEIEAGIEYRLAYFRRHISESESEICFAAWSGSRRGLCVGWYVAITPEGNAVAMPNEIRHAVIVGGEVGTQTSTFAYASTFKGWPTPVPLGNLGRLTRMDEAERAKLGLVVTASDGYSFSTDYEGPFWEPEKVE